jgi:FixJ family two-component response regulator
MMRNPIRYGDTRAVVYVVDDDASVRTALEDLISSIGLSARTFSSVDAFQSAQRPEVPSCLVLDVRMRGMSGLDLQAELAASGPDIPIVFITAHGDVPMSVRAMKAGAIDFLTKPFRNQDLLDAVHVALTRDAERRAVVERLHELKAQYGTLTDGERTVMTLVVAGLLNKQIAARLGLSEITIKVRRGHVMRKMQASSLPELVRMADTLGLSKTSA